MVNQILALEKMQVKEIMTPRVDMQCVEDTLGAEDLAEAVRKIKHRRVPIIHETPDTVEGILKVKDFLANPACELDEIVELPNFIPETMSVAKLLKSFRKQEHPVAIVVDEYGGTQGMVTLEDILEEIVGEIEDEFDEKLPETHVETDNVEIDGATSILDMASVYGIELPANGGFETIAGYMLLKLGHIPQAGEFTEFGRRRFTVSTMDRNRVARVRIEKIATPPESAGKQEEPQIAGH